MGAFEAIERLLGRHGGSKKWLEWQHDSLVFPSSFHILGSRWRVEAYRTSYRIY